MDERTLTHADLAQGAGVSVTSIKSYRAKFPGFIPVASWTKPIRFRPEALPVCVRIRALFAEGRSVAQVRAALAQEFPENAAEKPVEEVRNPFAAGVSERSFQEFFQAAGKMMQGMAALATAQARADQRLTRLERALEDLASVQAQGAEAMTRLAAEIGEWSAGAARPRKVVAVRGTEGRTETYAFEERAEPAPKPAPSDLPPEPLLGLPVAIRTERGEFLGVPGRLSLAAFAAALERQAGSPADWTRAEDGFVLTLNLGGAAHALRFNPATSPSGVEVALLAGLDLDGGETTPAFIQEFVRQVRERMDRA
ncbi:DNA-binding protein [Desulfovibrio sp.]